MQTLRRVARLAFISVAALVGVVVSIYLVVNVTASISARGQRAALSDEVTRRIAEELPESRRQVDTVSATIETEPHHGWVAQRCQFETNDAGWIVQDYREVCSLESAQAWEVASESEARTLLGTLVSGTRPLGSGGCHWFEPSAPNGGRDPWGESQLLFYYVQPGESTSRWCLPSARSYRPHRAVVGEVPDLDRTKGWLVVVQTDRLIDEVIGCTHWSVIFCDNPFGDEHAWGEPPR